MKAVPKNTDSQEYIPEDIQECDSQGMSQTEPQKYSYEAIDAKPIPLFRVQFSAVKFRTDFMPKFPLFRELKCQKTSTAQGILLAISFRFLEILSSPACTLSTAPGFYLAAMANQIMQLSTEQSLFPKLLKANQDNHEFRKLILRLARGKVKKQPLLPIIEHENTLRIMSSAIMNTVDNLEKEIQEEQLSDHTYEMIAQTIQMRIVIIPFSVRKQIEVKMFGHVNESIGKYKIIISTDLNKFGILYTRGDAGEYSGKIVAPDNANENNIMEMQSKSGSECEKATQPPDLIWDNVQNLIIKIAGFSKKTCDVLSQAPKNPKVAEQAQLVKSAIVNLLTNLQTLKIQGGKTLEYPLETLESEIDKCAAAGKEGNIDQGELVTQPILFSEPHYK